MNKTFLNLIVFILLIIICIYILVKNCDYKELFVDTNKLNQYPFNISDIDNKFNITSTEFNKQINNFNNKLLDMTRHFNSPYAEIIELIAPSANIDNVLSTNLIFNTNGSISNLSNLFVDNANINNLNAPTSNIDNITSKNIIANNINSNNYLKAPASNIDTMMSKNILTNNIFLNNYLKAPASNIDTITSKNITTNNINLNNNLNAPASNIDTITSKNITTNNINLNNNLNAPASNIDTITSKNITTNNINLNNNLKAPASNIDNMTSKNITTDNINLNNNINAPASNIDILNIGDFNFKQSIANNKKTLELKQGVNTLATFTADDNNRIKLFTDNNNNISINKSTDGINYSFNNLVSGTSGTGYTLNGDLNINGKLKIGNNITIKSDTNGDVITIGNGTTATNGKTRINIGKYSLVPNLSGNDDYIELRYNKDGVATNEKLIGKFSKDAGDKAVIYTNDNSSNYFYVNNEPSLGMYNNTQGASGWIGNIKTQGVFTNDVKNLNGGFVIRGLENSETKLCDGSTDCGKYIYIRNNENTSGFYKKTNEDTMFKIHSGDSRNTSIRNVGDNSEILNKDNKTRIRFKNDETNICAGDNCDNKQFYVKYGEEGVRGGFWNTESDNTKLQLKNKSINNDIEANGQFLKFVNNGRKAVSINTNHKNRLEIFTGRFENQGGKKYFYLNYDGSGDGDKKEDVHEGTCGW